MKQTSGGVGGGITSNDSYCEEEEEVFKSSQCEGQQKFEAADTKVKEIVATTEAAAVELRPHAHVVPRCINKASRGLTGLIAGNGTAGSDESIDVVNSSLPPPSQLFYQQQPQVITEKTSKADATSGSNSIFPHPKSSTPYNNNLLHSPSTSINFGQGNLHASTPISHYKNPLMMASSNYRGGERAKPSLFESPRSPLISNVALPDLISRKGGKNWRRSVNVAKFSPNGGRRVTIASNKPASTLRVSISFGSFF